MFALMPLVLKMIGVVAAADQASFASNSGNLTGVHDPVHFNAVHINRGGGLDQDTGRLLIQSWGLFLVTLSVGHPGAGASTSYSLRKDGSVMTSVYLGAASSAIDNTIGHDIVSFFNEQEELHIRSNSSNLYSTLPGKLTSWGTVSLSQAMGVGVGFGVCRTSSNVVGKISYDRIWANVGNSWNTGNNQFVAPVSGIYFFSFSVGAQSGVDHAISGLFVNGQQLFQVYRGRRGSFPVEIVSRSVMMHLFANDQVHVYSHYNGYSDLACLTTLSGFLYSSLRDEQLAWAVYRSSDYVGSADPLVYDHILVNEGTAWFENRAHCHITGLYYVNICAGTHTDRRAQLAVMKETEVQGEVTRHTSGNNGDTICRSMIIQCNAGETLRVTVSSSSLWAGGYERNLLSFIGFYLFP